MRLIVDQTLTVGFISINSRQQRASLPFKPDMLERKVYTNDDITFLFALMSTKPECDVLQPEPLLSGSGCNTLSRSGLANVNTGKRMFYPLSKHHLPMSWLQYPKVGHDKVIHDSNCKGPFNRNQIRCHRILHKRFFKLLLSPEYLSVSE